MGRQRGGNGVETEWKRGGNGAEAEWERNGKERDEILTETGRDQDETRPGRDGTETARERKDDGISNGSLTSVQVSIPGPPAERH